MVKFLFTLENPCPCPCPCHDVLSHLKVGAKINLSTFYVSLAKYFVHVLVKHPSDKRIYTYIDTFYMNMHYFHYLNYLLLGSILAILLYHFFFKL